MEIEVAAGVVKWVERGDVEVEEDAAEAVIEVECVAGR